MWKNLLNEQKPAKWVTLKVEREVEAWLKLVAKKHNSSVTRVLYAIVKSAYEDDTKEARKA